MRRCKPLELVAASALAVQAAADPAVVDPHVRHQVWEGWGTSLAWWAHIVGRLPEARRTELVDRIFGELRLNIVRYNIGGGENPTHTHLQPRAAVPGFLSPAGAYDWTADAGQRWVLRRAKALGVDRFEAFSNSPPWFMTQNGCASGAADAKDNLRPDQVAAFADYLAETVRHFQRRWDIEFETLAPLNEPSSDWWKEGGRQEGCHFSPGPRQSEVLEACAAALRRRGLATRMSASDEWSSGQMAVAWDAMSAAAKESVVRINTHSYFRDDHPGVLERARRDGKRLWMSEYGDGDASGMVMATTIVRDLRELSPSAWVYWQAIEQTPSRWGFIDMDLNGKPAKDGFTVNRKFYAMGNFSRFLRPGCQFVEIGDPNSVAAVRGDELVIVSLAERARWLDVDLTRFAGSGEAAQVHRTSPRENLAAVAPVPIVNGRFRARLPARSVSTFVVPVQAPQ